LIGERLDRLGQVCHAVKSEGAYYAFPRTLIEHRDSYSFSVELLEKAKVAVSRGSVFGPPGEHHVRMAYCVSEGVIETAFDRLEHYFSSLSCHETSIAE
jgi:aspartate/methionine/tyrosine aminotransferase